MKYLRLHHTFEFHSPLDHERARRLFAGILEPRRTRWFLRVGVWPFGGPTDLSYEGEMNGEGFTARRLLGYRNDFAPELEGVIAPQASGSKISIHMKLPFSTLMCIAFTLTISFVVAFEDWQTVLLLTLILCAIPLGSFWYEVNKQEKMLRAIFRAAA